ncbi:peptidase M22, glycoprotease [Fomitiporia mediterranea MF3/22]|uniref:peptidase M22, glycoprotease n=1 Tax=Fomitiporia mediterranea (strain MF3/22) TaxID=694068 RepID=UPI0004409927|nr:peptidase M22, glycoprotease [Fomitiporia mediterranea MF3/22]EJD03286.1 peptidase M22, glycoprotease [Fomitiporia mediterranea MF3/22]
MLLTVQRSLHAWAQPIYQNFHYSLKARNYLLQLRCLRRGFTVLALESSADDTCAAVVTSEKRILSNVVISQRKNVETHGGIEPFVAIQEHQRNMPVAVRRALQEAQLDMSRIDGIAFTRGPGMAGCLSVCSNAAKTLAAALGKPLVGVHHMQAHALTPILTSTTPSSTPTFPFLTLLISGGHTLLLLALSNSKFRILATTRDEAVGRAIDKVARELRVELRGRAPGAALEVFCRDGFGGDKKCGKEEENVPHVEPLKVPFKGELAFSFAGLHSAVDRYILQHGKDKTRLQLPYPHRLAIARTFQDAAFAQLEEKVILALRWCADNSQIPVKHVVVSGGVASNLLFRERLQACLSKNFPDDELSLVFPPPALCTDNAAMIAWASMHRFLAGESDDYSIEHRAKWSIEKLDAS